MKMVMMTILIFTIIFMSSCNSMMTKSEDFIDIYQWTQELNVSNYGMSSPFIEYDDFVVYCTDFVVKCFSYDGQYLPLADIPNGRLYDDSGVLYCNSDKKLYTIDYEKGLYSLVYDFEEINPELSSINDFFIIGDYVYVLSGVEIYKTNIITKETDMILNDVYSASNIGDKIYYTDHAERTFSIYEFNINSGTISLQRGNGETFYAETLPKNMYDSVIAVKGSLYYSTRFPTAIYRYNSDGEDFLIDDFSSESFAEDKLTLLYLYSDTKSLYAAYVQDETVIFKKYDLENATKSVLGQIPYFSVYRSYAIYHNMLIYRSNPGDENNLYHLFD